MESLQETFPKPSPSFPISFGLRLNVIKSCSLTYLFREYPAYAPVYNNRAAALQIGTAEDYIFVRANIELLRNLYTNHLGGQIESALSDCNKVQLQLCRTEGIDRSTHNDDNVFEGY
jgi:hypothetical protein